MSTEIPAKDLKVAVESLNKVLEKSHRIKLLKRKREDVLTDLTDKIVGFIEEGKEAELPNDVIEFYNTHIASEEGEDSSEEDEASSEESPAAPAKKSNKKTKKTKKPDSASTSSTVPGKKGNKPATSKKDSTVSEAKSSKGSKTSSESPQKKKSSEKSSVSNEQLAFNMVSEGKSDKEITKVFTDLYKSKGVTDSEFITKRIAIYVNIAKRKISK